MSIQILQLSLVVACSIAAGLIGFWMSRRQFRQELDAQQRVYGTELARLRRHANAAEAKRHALRQEVEKLRRRQR